jgi:hypothetical protein
VHPSIFITPRYRACLTWNGEGVGGAGFPRRRLKFHTVIPTKTTPNAKPRG